LKEELTDKKKVGIVVKGCDSRALVELLKENIITRDKIYIIGIRCNGCVSFEKVLDALKDTKNSEKYFAQLQQLELKFEKDDVIARLQKEPSPVIIAKFPKNALLDQKCFSCISQEPVIFDTIFGEIEQIIKKEYEKIQIKPNMFEKCIRCHACRQICPLCYCDECAFDPIQISMKPDTTITEKLQRPHWIERTPTLSENLFYHIGRQYHLAGRCVNCGECNRVCPMKIKLSVLTEQLSAFVKEYFQYTPGMNADEKPLLAFFKDIDKDVTEYEY
jgi:Fe-S oxidoreductase